ncbi:MAG: STAS domain-containing protein [Phycisphaerales bacterium]|nr:STAS domain-containing protein [Phycisphaerales bacterium]
MFGKSRTAPPPVKPAPVAGPAERVLTTFDQLGQTLVSTLTVSTLSGQDSSDLARQLTERIAASGDEEYPPVRHVVLDLQNVQYMDSMCIGVLVELLTKLREGGGRIALVNTAHNVEYLFKLTRLDRVFPICRDVMKAIEVVERAAA